MYTGAAVVMGVASCGKTVVGEAIAAGLGVRFIEGDHLHAPASIAKMSAGIALTDDDRWPWLARIGEALGAPGGVIVSCSALKKSYRQAIADAAGRPVSFIFLNGSRALLEQRMGSRQGHFMPTSLLSSQLATLEIPSPDEGAIALDIANPTAVLAQQAIDFLTRGTAHD